MIYFDHAATSLMRPKCVEDAVIHAMKTSGNAGRGAHAASLSGGRILHNARKEIADFFHAPGASSVVFTSNATESLNTVLLGLFSAGDHVITTDWEHNSVLRPLYQLEDAGVEISILSWESDIGGNLYHLRESLKSNTKGIVCTHASNVTGMVTDISKIGMFAKEHGLFLIADAAQTAGMIPINMQQMGVDALCFSGHKGLLGPQGTGGICLSERTRPKPLKVGGSGTDSFSRFHPKNLPSALEAGTLNCQGIAGLHAGVCYINEIGLDAVCQQGHQFMDMFLQGILSIPNLILYGDFSSPSHLPIIPLNIKDVNSGVVEQILYEEYGIAVRSGIHCAPLLHKRFQTECTGMVRFSFSHLNTRKEIETGIYALHEIAASFM